MVWFTKARQIAVDGKPTGRYRMTATSDEDGGGPFGDESHDHATPEEAEACERCDEYIARVTGFPSRRQQANDQDLEDRRKYCELKLKYGNID